VKLAKQLIGEFILGGWPSLLLVPETGKVIDLVNVLDFFADYSSRECSVYLQNTLGRENKNLRNPLNNLLKRNQLLSTRRTLRYIINKNKHIPLTPYEKPLLITFLPQSLDHGRIT
jgi:hypothetical protein